ncbi:hypothetical protein CEV31_0150 [Brucella thiophenivorans]|uniref:Uncharacterized protein n=1 Tax=Brucella thiophenivorans TaxID=571255 RepID=A0A256G6F4_9HYPH|nr:hypothetical protein CEV31_0150 [Brucella thiophenivorans]
MLFAIAVVLFVLEPLERPRKSLKDIRADIYAKTERRTARR